MLFPCGTSLPSWSLTHNLHRLSDPIPTYEWWDPPQARSHFHSAGPHPSQASFTVRSSRPHMRGNSFLLGTNVTIPSHLSHESPLTCEGTTSINLGIMKVMSTWIFVILIRYCHSSSQRGRAPTQVQAGSPGSERGVEGAGPNQLKMWYGPGHVISPLVTNDAVGFEK